MFRRSPAETHGVPDTWLYEKGDSSVRIVRTGAMDFEVFGPGRRRARHVFAGQEQIMSFLQQTGDQLTASGYRQRGYGIERREEECLLRFDDRRRG